MAIGVSNVNKNKSKNVMFQVGHKVFLESFFSNTILGLLGDRKVKEKGKNELYLW